MRDHASVLRGERSARYACAQNCVTGFDVWSASRARPLAARTRSRASLHNRSTQRRFAAGC
ncbi:hypothetical protein XCR_3991 [Xanthomonas campestris pv. raphani 756C]|nr:hypothetical protein XCR_3991 [Xanthomonas campestris pv. raphani 756C]